MHKQLITFIFILVTTISLAQQGIYSPYSFFGIGSPAFKGTTENRAMGGLSIVSDSIHLNLQNPAAFSDLKLTTFTAGMTVNSTTFNTEALASESFKNTTVDYIAVGIPTKVGGFGAGLKPFSAVGYRLEERIENQKISIFQGRGGLNTVYLSWGKKVFKNFSIGATANYNFGESENKTLLFLSNTEYGSRDVNQINYGGASFNFSAMYDITFNENYNFRFLGALRPESPINTDQNRRVATITIGSSGNENVQDEFNLPTSSTSIKLAEQYTYGVSLGKKLNWQIGLEYRQTGASNFDILTFNTTNNLVYTEARSLRIGGFYVPRYDHPTNVFRRWTYRFGFRLEETGMRLNNQDISEYGITFGIGIPSGRYFTNANIGVEYGSRGTTSSGLVQENFLSMFLSFSFNDKWFVEKKYN